MRARSASISAAALTASKATAAGSAPSRSERIVGTPTRSPQVASWSANHLSRVAKRSKRYVREPGLLGHLLGIDRRAALRNADAAGRLIDTFVVAQLRSELAYM